MHATEDETLLHYQIDPRDTLTFVSDDWDLAATTAGSPHLQRQAILGVPLWRFISDVGTSEIYRHVLSRVRAGSAVDLTLRCDTPELRRTIGLRVSAAPDGTVDFRSRVISATARPYQALLDARTPRSSRLLHVCGWCKKVQVQGSWVEVEEAVALLRLFDDAVCPRMSHGICEPCLATFTA